MARENQRFIKIPPYLFSLKCRVEYFFGNVEENNLVWMLIFTNQKVPFSF